MEKIKDEKGKRAEFWVVGENNPTRALFSTFTSNLINPV